MRNSLQLEDFLGSITNSAGAPDFAEALESLLAPLPFVRSGPPARKESLHAVMIDFAAQRELAPERLAAIQEGAIRGELVVHGISPDRSGVLAKLADATGGMFLVSRGRIENSGCEMLTVYNALLSNYRIEFEASEVDEIRLGVWQRSVFGEVKMGKK